MEDYINIERLKYDPDFLEAVKHAIIEKKFPRYNPADPPLEVSDLESQLMQINDFQKIQEFVNSQPDLEWPTDQEISAMYHLVQKAKHLEDDQAGNKIN